MARSELRRSACAISTAARTSLTPAITADRATNSASQVRATNRASVVLPVPGGPHRIIECRLRPSIRRRSGFPGASRCDCPTNSSRLVGRMRSASGRTPPDAAAEFRSARATSPACRASSRGPAPPPLRRCRYPAAFASTSPGIGGAVHVHHALRDLEHEPHREQRERDPAPCAPRLQTREPHHQHEVGRSRARACRHPETVPAFHPGPGSRRSLRGQLPRQARARGAGTRAVAARCSRPAVPDYIRAGRWLEPEQFVIERRVAFDTREVDARRLAELVDELHPGKLTLRSESEAH